MKYKLVCFDVDGTLIDNITFSWQLFHDYFKTNMGFRKAQYVHPINWNNANLDSFGIQHASPDLDEDAWQFAISKASGRVHGFFIGDSFYVVWIDPEHRLNKYWTPN